MRPSTEPPTPAAAQPARSLDLPLAEVPGIGTERMQALRRLGLETVGDLLQHRPLRYEDRRSPTRVADLALGQPALVLGTVVAAGVKRLGKSGKSVFEAVIDDGSGRLHCRWWNMPFLSRVYRNGMLLFAYGKPCHLKPRRIDHPEIEEVEEEQDPAHVRRIVPVYPLTESISQRWLRTLIWKRLPALLADVCDPHASLLAETPNPSLPDAYRMIHAPEDPAEMERGRRRLALHEFLTVQSQLAERRHRLDVGALAPDCSGTNRRMRPFLAELPYQLTPSQTAVLREIRGDLRGPRPMRRLLQGDVGSGKTVVAAAAALMALENNRSVALMAPTELLAVQHFNSFRAWFAPMGIPVTLHTASFESPEDGAVAAMEGEPDGSADGTPAGPAPPPAGIRIGTHALLEEDVDVGRLGLVIIDEQHRFGVAQRERLLRKGRHPHLLVMTATPIPRTLALAWYGDLDTSILRHPPAQRGVTQTHLRPSAALPRVWEFLKAELAAGRQAYVVLPRIDSEEPGVKVIEKEFATIQEALHPHRCAVVHGRLASNQRADTMEAFRANAVAVLIATSIIEVGVDVPNATVIVILSAELFGLAQLHQLRGRIGRGTHASHCILVSDAAEPLARERLGILERTGDGFELAEADLRLRGTGELLGSAQSGMPRFTFADLARDHDLMLQARELTRAALPPGRT